MSKLNNLIGFWNSKSAEQEAGSPKPARPKSEIIDRNFVRRLENFPGGQESPRERGGVRFLLSEGIKVSSRDDKTQPCSPRLREREARAEMSVSPGEYRQSNRPTVAQTPPGKRGLSPASPISPASPASPVSPLTTSTPASPAWSSKPQSPFAKFQQLDNNWSSSQDSVRAPPGPSRSSNLYRNSSMPASTPRPAVASQAVRSGSGAKEMILMWVQNRIRDYPIPMTNFSTCWNNGLAFCALIHVFYPDNFDWFSLKAENRRHNFTLAFQKAEELAGIYPLLEVDDMVRFQKPDWKCVFTYVQSFYRRFRDGRSPPPRTAGGGKIEGGGGGGGGGGELKLSEVARAVAECQEAEQTGRQIVRQVSASQNQPVEVREEKSREQEKEKEEEKEKGEEEQGEAGEVSSDLPVRAVEPTAPVTEETPHSLHTETASISLKSSPATLSPKSTKMSRSISVASEHPETGEDSSGVQERKLSFNHPRPSMSPPALQL